MSSPTPAPLSAPDALAGPSTARARWELLGITLACLGMAWGACLPVLRLDGWPNNHEGLSIFERAEGFRRAFAAGDFFPLWTPFCFNGHGSPWPFFYHRLFTTVSGGLAWMLGSTYHGVRLSLVAVLFLGTTGTAAAARRLGASGLIQVFAAFLLCSAPYTFFDWLVRGAAAEFCAMMLYPWLLWACARLLSDGRGGVATGFIFVLLFYAHTVMFLYALPTFLIALGFMLARRGWRSALITAVQAALPVLVLCAPYAALLLRLEKDFNMAALGIFTPEREFLPLGRYLWDTEFHWGLQWERTTPALGPALLVSLGLLTAVALASRGARPGGWNAALGFLVLCALPYALLQASFTAPFYRGVPLANLIQFPWRLVGFLITLLVLMWSMLVQEPLRRGGWRRGLALAAVGLPTCAGLGFCWTATHPRYEVASRAFIEQHLAQLDRPWSTYEYLPRSVIRVGLAPPMPFLFQQGCARMTTEPAQLQQPVHFKHITLVVSSDQGCDVYFNQFQTPFLAAESSGPARFFTTQVGTLGIHVPPGEQRIELRRRGFLELLARTFWRAG